MQEITSVLSFQSIVLGFDDVSPYVCTGYFSSVKVAEWSPFGKELLTRLTIISLCILTICNFSFFPDFVLWAGFGS